MPAKTQRAGRWAAMAVVVAIVLATAMPPGGATAEELSDLLSQDAGTPLEIFADKVSANAKDKTISYRDKVRVEYGSLRLTADALDYDHGRDGRLDINGSPVKAAIGRKDGQGGYEIHARNVSMRKPYQQVVFTGDVYVYDDGHQVKADKLYFDLDKMIYTGEGIKLSITDIEALTARPGEDDGDGDDAGGEGGEGGDSSPDARPAGNGGKDRGKTAKESAGPGRSKAAEPKDNE